MSIPPKYFRLALTNNKEDIKKIGYRVFENHNLGFLNGLTNNSIILDIIFRYLANYNIEKAEEELINRGFAVVNTDDVPRELIEQIPYLISDRYNSASSSFFDNKEEALKYLSKNLPLMTDSLKLYLKKK